MEKIEINDFVGIKHIEIEVNKINILIGPQATGKSIVAKLLFYFKSFVSDMVNTALAAGAQEDLRTNFKDKFEDYFPPSSWGTGSFRIRYAIDRRFIKVYRETSSPEISLSYSGFYEEKFVEFRTFIERSRDGGVNGQSKMMFDLFDGSAIRAINQELLGRIEKRSIRLRLSHRCIYLLEDLSLLISRAVCLLFYRVKILSTRF